MAHRRGHASQAPLWFGLAGAGILLILAASMQIGGAVTNLRQDIQVLERGCDELHARQALLSLHWNSESSRHVVIARAEQEIDLMCPDEPSLLLVAAPMDGGDDPAAGLALDFAQAAMPQALAGEER